MSEKMTKIIQDLNRAKYRYIGGSKSNHRQIICPIALFQMFTFVDVVNTDILITYNEIVAWQSRNYSSCCEFLPSILFLVANVLKAAERVGIAFEEMLTILKLPSRLQMIASIQACCKTETVTHLVYMVTVWNRFKICVFNVNPSELPACTLLLQNKIDPLIIESFRRRKDLGKSLCQLVEISKNVKRNKCSPEKKDTQKDTHPTQKQIDDLYRKNRTDFLKFISPQADETNTISKKSPNQIMFDVITHWKEYTTSAKNRSKIRILNAVKKWKRFVRDKKKAKNKIAKRNQKLELLKQQQKCKQSKIARNTLVSLFICKIGDIFQRVRSTNAVCRWKKYIILRIRKKVMCQIVKNQWINRTVFPHRLQNIKMERILIHLFAQLIIILILHVAAVFKVPNFKRDGIACFSVLENMGCADTQTKARKACHRYLNHPFFPQMMKKIQENKLTQQFKSVDVIFTEMRFAVQRFIKGLDNFEKCVPEDKKKDLYSEVFNKKIDVPILDMLRWQRNYKTPRYIIFVSEEVISQKFRDWLLNFQSKSKADDITTILNNIIPGKMLDPNGNATNIFSGDLRLFSSHNVQIQFNQKN